MALAPTPFVWGRGGRRMTPEEIAREREIADKLGMQAGDTSPVGHWTQGAARVVNALGGVLADRRANAASELNAAEDKTALTGLLGLLGGGSNMSPTTANVASALVPSDGGTPAQTAMVEGQPPIPGLQRAPSGMEAYRDAIASIESAGSGDYAAVGPTHPKMGRALGRYQIMESNIPAWSQEVLGRAVTAEEFMANPQLQDAIFDGKFGEYVNKFGPEGAAQAWFGGPGGVGKTNRKDVLGTSIGEYGQKFNKAIGGAQTGYVDHMVSAQPAMPVSAQPAAQAPAASGGIMDAIAPPMSEGYFPPAPSAPQAGGIDPAVIEALSSPYASPQTKQVASMLLERTMSQQQQAQERALQEQQRAQEIQQRQAFLQANGLDPSIAMVDEAWAEAAKAPFRPRNTAVVNGVLVDAETGAPIYEGQPEATTGMRDYQAYAQFEQSQGRTPLGPLEYEQAVRSSGAPKTTIDMAGDKFEGEFAKLDAQALNTVATSGLAAQRNIGRIDQLEGLLAESPSGFQAALAQRAGELGINTEGLDTLQAAQAVINSLIPEQRPPGSGPMSDRDVDMFKQSLPRTINQPGGNKIIIDAMRGIARYDAEGAAIVQRLRNGDISRAQAFEQLQNRVNPLAGFKAAPETPPPASEDPLPPQKITSKDQFDRLPSGTRFIDPQGNVRIKP